jgi:PAS domain-containing protein
MIFLVALIIVCVTIIIFSRKLRNSNRELRQRNRQIEDINDDLQKTNRELAVQKENITREYSYSEMFYRMLVQSADDGISFYDRDWNLKYANKAFIRWLALTRISIIQ